MSENAFFADRSFLAPAFRIKLHGQDTERHVIADVLEVSFTDDLENIDSFEFVLHDWDTAEKRPKYSSPWDYEGNLLKVAPGGKPVPVFEPGAPVSLYMGYSEEGELPLIMEGEVISLSPSFPASGAPTCRVRALDALQRDLQKIYVEGNYSGTKKAIVDKLCQENDIKVQWPVLKEGEGTSEKAIEVEGILYDEIQKRVADYGLSMVTVRPAEGKPILSLLAPGDKKTPVADLIWGLTLINFTPVFSAKGQVAEVVVRWGDPNAKKKNGSIEVKKTWQDVRLKSDAVGLPGKAEIATAVRKQREIIKPERVKTEAEAAVEAIKHLTNLAKTLITGNGSTVGLPILRAGELVTILGLGARFDGDWRLTQTTHSIGGAGYTTTFQARKEVLDA